MQPKRTAVATLLVCALAVPVAVTAQKSLQSREGGAAMASTSGALMPFIAPTFDCESAVCDVPQASDHEKQRLNVLAGERYADPDLVTQPGRYGLPDPPEGESYAVVGHKLVRIDADSFRVLSILRDVSDQED